MECGVVTWCAEVVGLRGAGWVWFGAGVEENVTKKTIARIKTVSVHEQQDAHLSTRLLSSHPKILLGFLYFEETKRVSPSSHTVPNRKNGFQTPYHFRRLGACEK